MGNYMTYIFALLLALPSTQPNNSGVPEDRLYSLSLENGRFVVTPKCEGSFPIRQGRYWSCQDGEAKLDDYRPKGYFTGHVTLESHGANVAITGWKEQYKNWDIIRLSVIQTPEFAKLSYTIRTPVGQPDITDEILADNLSQLLVRNPQFAPLFQELFKGLDCDFEFEFDPLIWWQIEGSAWHQPPEIEKKVNSALSKIASSNWRERDKGEKELRGLGRDGIMYILQMDRTTLSSQQNLVIDNVKKAFPLLTYNDKVMCRQEPERLSIFDRSKVATTQSD
jgi:hypothetical protein